MKTWKRMASAFLAVCMLMSLMVFPSVSAVTQLDETITLGFGDPVWDSGVCTVPVTATSAGDSFGARNIELLVKFDPAILQLDKVTGHVPNVVKVIEEDGEEEEVKYRMSPSSITTKLDADKYGDMSLQDMINQKGCVYLLLVDTSTEHSDDHIITSGSSIVDLKFTAQSDKEGQSSVLSFESVDAPYYEGKEIIIGTAAEGVYHITADATTTVTVPGGDTTTYTVTFDANEGTGSMEDVKVNQGDKLTLPANGFTAPEGKQFKAWSVGDTEYQPNTEIDIAADTTVKAIWEDIPVVTYTVTFDANEGTGSMEDVKVNQGDKLTLPANGFTAPEGKQFKAWSVGDTEYQP
ncbi:MAG: InlB B-repeat-containing protein, partial [Oscillospiraceae bacterium]|nr:InlB B-repeat-containing protein [Oscillospiraceae bacterium]